MVTKTTRMSTARPRTIIAGRMEIPPGVGGRCGSGPSLPSAGARCRCRAASWRRPAYGRSDHPKWSRGPCPAPSRQPAPPARARATKALACVDRLGHVAPRARWAAMAAEREQPVPWSLPVSTRSPGQHDDPVGAGHDVVGRLGEVASLDHDVAGARSPGSARPPRPGPRASPRDSTSVPPEHGRLAQVRGDDQRVGEEPARGRRRRPSGSSSRCPVEDTRTGSTTSWGSSPCGGQRRPPSVTMAVVRQHPGLDAAHVEVVEHRLDLLAHERGLEGHDAAHLGRVLRRHRGQGARAVHADGRRRS